MLVECVVFGWLDGHGRVVVCDVDSVGAVNESGSRAGDGDLLRLVVDHVVTASMANDIDADPIGIVTLDETVASVTSLLARSTTRRLLVLVLRVIVAVAAPAPAASDTESTAMTSVNVAKSSSVTARLSVPSTKPAALAVSVTVCVPSTTASSTASISTAGDVVSPAAIVTEAGSVASLVSLLSKLTTRGLAISPSRVTVTVAAAAPALSENDRAEMVKTECSHLVVSHFERVCSV